MSFTIWFTGISGSGKTTLSKLTANYLHGCGLAAELVDGDAVREFLGKDLGFGERDRRINTLTLGLVASLLNKNGIIAVVAAISPYKEPRQRNREIIGRYYEVFCDCSVEKASSRDVKGLYRKALRGDIKDFTGVSAPYEPPVRPEITVFSGRECVEESFARIKESLIAIVAPASNMTSKIMDCESQISA